jgi:hypothetical protein
VFFWGNADEKQTKEGKTEKDGMKDEEKRERRGSGGSLDAGYIYGQEKMSRRAQKAFAQEAKKNQNGCSKSNFGLS